MNKQRNRVCVLVAVVVALAAAGFGASAGGANAPGDRALADGIVQAESAAVRSVGGPDGPAWNLWSNGHVAEPMTFEQTGTFRVTVRARGNADGDVEPVMELRIDGEPQGQLVVRDHGDWTFEDYTFTVTASAGQHEIGLALINDPRRPDQNVDLVIDWWLVEPLDGDQPTSTDQPTTTEQPTSTDQPTTTEQPTSTQPSTTEQPTSTQPSTTPPTTTQPSTTTTSSAPPETGPPEDDGRSAYVPDGYSLAWNDEFDSLSLDLNNNGDQNWATMWVRWNVLSLAGNGDQCMKGHPGSTGTGGPALGLETHRVNNGALTLFGRPIPDNRRSQFWGYEAACGMISGELSHSQTYGYWETRMRIPNVSTGHHWAIWLLPEDGSWPPEVDMLEVVGTNQSRNTDERRFHYTGHYPTANGKDAQMSFENAPGAADDWYTVGLEWTPDAVIWYLDGREVHRMWNFIGQKPNYFLISPEIGGNWSGPTGGSTEWPMSMEVDYVRIYQAP